MDIDLTPAILEFLQEAEDLCVDLEETLLSLEQSPGDDELINAAFRAAHTIKGSAGMFGFTQLVDFTHVFESVLMRLRDKEIELATDLSKLLLECVDQLNKMVEQIDVTGEQIDEETAHHAKQLVELLKVHLEDTNEETSIQSNEHSVSTVAPAEVETDTASDHIHSNTDNWHISIRFGEDVMRGGMDPLSFINFLTTTGEIVSIELVDDQMPDWKDYDPESCYLGCEIQYKTDLDKAGILDIFEFIIDECVISVIPPHSLLDEYLEAFEAVPESSLRLGDILVQIGAITQSELDYCLQQQAEFDINELRQAEADETSDGGGPVIKASGTKQEAPQLGQLLVENKALSEKGLETVLNKQTAIREQQKRENQSLRIDAQKLDQLINQIGELVISSASAQLQVSDSNNDHLRETIDQMSNLIEEVREGCLKLRMIPIGSRFNKFHRTVRDLSKKLNKDIVLECSGEDTEMDKSMVEKISDPLMHLVRNSIDHGIENAADRAAAGKPEQGRVELNAFHDSGNINIEIKDDGRGLQKQKILQRALENGIVEPDHQLSEQEIYRLIFAPGFSTAEEVTDVSGRGVGMDVVNRNIEDMRGNIVIESEEGQGTTIRISLPLTLAIIDGFMMVVDNQTYVVPLEFITECIEANELEASDLTSDFINLRGEVLPVIRLRRMFKIPGRGERESIVVVKFEGKKAGLVVDSLLGEYQTVIKPVSPIFRKLSWLAGSTVLGSGEIALILDIPGLVKRMETLIAHEHTTSIEQVKD